eukprot:3330841-Rhodomonas_salina.1
MPLRAPGREWDAVERGCCGYAPTPRNEINNHIPGTICTEIAVSCIGLRGVHLPEPSAVRYWPTACLRHVRYWPTAGEVRY